MLQNSSTPLIKRQINDYVTGRFFCRYYYREKLVKLFPEPKYMEILSQAKKLEFLNKIVNRLSDIKINGNETLNPTIYRRDNGYLAIKTQCDSYELFLKIGRVVKQTETRFWIIGFLKTIPEKLSVSNDILYYLLWIISIGGLLYSIPLSTMPTISPFLPIIIIILIFLLIIAIFSYIRKIRLEKVERLYILENLIRTQPLLTPIDYMEIAKALNTSIRETKELIDLLIQELSITGHFRTENGLLSKHEYFVYTGQISDLQEGRLENPEVIEEVTCMRCGAVLPNSAESGCPECGFNLTECAICNRNLDFDDNISLCPHCGSQFHNSHILEWLKIKGSCPVCRNELHENELREISIMGILRLLK